MTLTELYNLVFYFSIGSVTIPFTSCLIKLKTLNQTLRVLFIYVMVAAATELLSLQLAVTKNVSAYHAVQNSFTLLECLLLGFIYYMEFKQRLSRRIILLLLLAYLVVAFWTLLYITGFSQPNNIISTLESCLMIGLATSFFYKVNSELNIPRLKEYYFFWLNSAVLIYFSTSFFLFLFDEYLSKYGFKSFYLLYGVHELTNIACNILFAIGIWKTKR
jgi:hypothetical protein